MVQHVKGNLRLAPALIQMEAEANRLAPNRSKISDGSFPSAAHTAANPTSDHEVGDALDLTTDPPEWDMAERFRLIVARKDRRVKYLIHQGTIWKSYPNRGLPPWTPQVYTGSNAHKSHGHTSVLHEHRDDTSPWWPELEEDDMTPEERKMLAEIHESIVGRKTGTAGGLIHDYSKATRTDVQVIRKHIEAASDDD
jgi:hypothetical protein